MKKIFLIGDSIRFGATGSPGYGRFVKEGLSTKAEVFAPNDNCRFAQYTLRYLHEWAANINGDEMDVVHWNNGLWDVVRIYGDEPLTEINDYVKTLERVYKRIKQLFPNAQVIFATSTPVLEEKADKNFLRLKADIEKYNEEAKALMNSLNVAVNDLHAIASKWDESFYSDWVHFNDRASKILADAVIRAIETI